ncbi:MAG: FAD-binding protein, partial [Mycetocola sp.]
MTDPQDPIKVSDLLTLGPLDAFTTKTIAALFDTVIPQDDWPSGWAGGGRRLLSEQIDGFLSWAVPALIAAAEELNTATDSDFVDLAPEDRTLLLQELLARESQVIGAPDPTEPPDWNRLASTQPLNTCVDLAFQAFYGGTREPAGWAMVGFNPIPGGTTPIDPEPLTGVSVMFVAEEYDVIVIGGGGGGGFAAYELARRGQRVLMVERSRPIRDAELRGNHLQGKRQELYDVIAGPGKGSPRVLELDDGSTRLLPGDGSGPNYGLNAMTLGGGTRVWQGMSWRFLPEDFRMASTYGVPEHSTLVDWPITYDDLEPYYER